MNNINIIANNLLASDLTKPIKIAQSNRENEIFFSINKYKEEVYVKKKANFYGKKFKEIYVVYNLTNFNNVNSTIDGRSIKKIDVNFIINSSTEELSKLFSNSLIILTNNLFAMVGINKLVTINDSSENSIWLIQDYDNHHWIENSISISLFADIYVPSHIDGEINLFSKLNPNISTVVPCGSNQWSYEFLLSKKNDLLTLQRNSEPLGKYYYYDKFIHRNKVINTINSQFKSVSLINNDFHQLSSIKKWTEWASHKLHWIIPTANDLPIRFFDALITGGLPLIPKSLSPSVQLLNIPDEFYRLYSHLDIINAKEFIDRQNNYYESKGHQGMVDRNQFCLDFYHVDRIISKLISIAENYYR